jgi:dUTP pyrophosphatase
VIRVLASRTGPVEVPLPSYQTTGAAGADLHAALAEPITLAPGERRLIPTGLVLAIPEGYEGQVRPRSGLALKHGIGMVNAPGTIDSDYRGPVGVLLVNHGHEPYVIEPLARIGQLVLAPVTRAEFVLTGELGETSRGSGGFGSTG